MRHCYLVKEGERDEVCEMSCHDHGSDTTGICNIPICSLRSPLENALCRTGIDDECFVYTPPGSTEAICVSDCPAGSEEELNAQGASTGHCVVTECSSLDAGSSGCGNVRDGTIQCYKYENQCVSMCPINYKTSVNNGIGNCLPVPCDGDPTVSPPIPRRIPHGDYHNCSQEGDISQCYYIPCENSPCEIECSSSCGNNYVAMVDELYGIWTCGPKECSDRKPQGNNYDCTLWEDINNNVECFPINNKQDCGTECGVNEDATVTGSGLTSCVLKPCADRQPVGNSCSTGNTDLCYFAEGRNECVSECPEFTYLNGFICSLYGCSSRQPNAYGSCALNALDMCTAYNGVCNTNCPMYTSYENSNLKICVDQQCTSRSANCVDGVCYCSSNPAEDTCAYFTEIGSPFGGSCAECPNSLYEKSNTGQCVFKTCLARQVNTSSPLVCGTDCYFTGTLCSNQCPAFSTPSPNGICGAPTEDCSNREVQNVPVEKCGTICAYDPTTNTCVGECPKYYTRVPTTGACELTGCDQRVPDLSQMADVCGPNCVSASETRCSDVCPEFYDLNIQTKRCELRSRCPDRVYSPTADRGCGPGCVFDPEGDSCGYTCPVFHTENVVNGICENMTCPSREPSPGEQFVCGPFPCFQFGYVCVVSCPSGQISDERGICVIGSKLSQVVVGGGKDSSTCGAVSSPCSSLDYVLHSRINIGGNISVIGASTLGSDGSITNLNIEGSNGVQTITVTKSVTLSFTPSSSVTTNITNLLFNITSSAITKTLILAPSVIYSSTSSVNLNNVAFNYKITLNAPLIFLDGLNNVNIVSVGIYRIVANSNGLLNNANLNNADDNICASDSTKPGLLLRNVVGKIEQSIFSGINTGAIAVSGGTITLDGITFTNNSVVRPTEFPNLRHNVFASNNAQLNVQSISADTGDSYFIYAAENSNVVINNVQSPLFIPVFLSAQPPSLSNDTLTTFAFTGRFLYPCDLYFNLYRDEPSNILSEALLLNVADENTATTSLSNSLFSVEGRYFGYFIYGPRLSLRTPAVELLVDSSQESQKGAPAGLIVGIVLAVVAVAFLLIIIVIFLLWRWKIQKMQTTETERELMAVAGEGAKVSMFLGHFCVIIVFLFFFFK
jgi:hypothetical protein